jgi:hypothetical protein
VIWWVLVGLYLLIGIVSFNFLFNSLVLIIITGCWLADRNGRPGSVVPVQLVYGDDYSYLDDPEEV